MPNIPNREQYGAPARPNIPSGNPPPRNVPGPYANQRSTPPRVINDPRRSQAANMNINYKQLQRPVTANKNERINPIKPSKKAQTAKSAAKSGSKKKNQYKERTVTHEFLLGFFVGLLIFGVAAIFICAALIGLFT